MPRAEQQALCLARRLQGDREPRSAGKPGALAALLRLTETHVGAWIHAALDIVLQCSAAASKESTAMPAGTAHLDPATRQSPPVDATFCARDFATAPDVPKCPGVAAQDTESQRLARDACFQAVCMLEGMMLPAIPVGQIEQVAEYSSPPIARFSHRSAQLQDGKVAAILDPQVAQNTEHHDSGNGVPFTRSEGSMEGSQTTLSEEETGLVEGYTTSCIDDASSVKSCEAGLFLPSHDQMSPGHTARPICCICCRLA
jgi:hypothetical protein